MPLSQIEETKQSLERLQQFDTSQLPRTAQLGEALNFQDVVQPANRLIDLYKQLAIAALNLFPDNVLLKIKQQADADFSRLKSVLDFQPHSPNPKAEHDQLLKQIQDAYNPTFTALHPYISYSTRTAIDFSNLERDARAHLQSAQDSTSELQKELRKQRDEMDEVLKAVRKTAEEQGVSQQAIYFKKSADDHETASEKWLTRTIWLTISLVLYAVATLFLHKWSYLSPVNAYETVQLAVSKVLIFATISFALALSVRNYLANRHNTVVNRHRQNALVTYRAIVEAAGATANRDVVLAKAADCIFTAQPTAFSKFDSVEGSNISLVNIPDAGGIQNNIGN